MYAGSSVSLFLSKLDILVQYAHLHVVCIAAFFNESATNRYFDALLLACNASKIFGSRRQFLKREASINELDYIEWLYLLNRSRRAVLSSSSPSVDRLVQSSL